MMVRIITFFILYLFSSFGSTMGQNIFVLEKPGRMKIFYYKQRDPIKLKAFYSDEYIAGKISKVTDSSLVINYSAEVLIKDIQVIRRGRWGFKFLQGLFLTSGIFYISLSTLNGLINNDNPIVPSETLVISGSLIGAGIILSPLTNRNHKIDEENWRIKILDFTE